MGNFYINNTLLVRKLKQKGGMLEANTESDYNSVVFKTENNENVYVYYNIRREENVKPLNMLDFLILDVAYMIYRDDGYRERFSVRELIHAVSGGEESCSPKRIQEFTEEIEKLRNTIITIDYSEEAREKGYEEGRYRIEMPLLPVEKTGKRYKFSGKPPLYKYAEVNNQVIVVPDYLFYCENLIGNTRRNFLIKYYILHELEIMRYVGTGKYAKDEILYFKKSDRNSEPHKGLFTEIDWRLDESDLNLIKYTYTPDIKENITTVEGLHTIESITETVKKLLDYYIEIGYISEEGYELIRRTPRSAVMGIKINGTIKAL